MAFKVDSIDHVEVFVRDIDPAVAWYQRVLGLELIHRWEPEPAFIGAGTTALAIFRATESLKEVGNPTRRETPGWHRVAWGTTREGFDEAQRHLKACGVSFRGPIDHDIAFSIYFHDPDGNLLEITREA